MANPILEFSLEGLEAPLTLELVPALGDVIIGRAPDCQLVLQSASVSRRHARVTRQGQDLLIEDLGSSNGTLVNGSRVTSPRALKDKDELKLGSISGRFLVPPDEAIATIAIGSEEAATLFVPPEPAAPPTIAVPPPPQAPPVPPPRPTDPSLTARGTGTVTTQMPEAPPEPSVPRDPLTVAPTAPPVEAATSPPIAPPTIAVPPPALPTPPPPAISVAPASGPGVGELAAIAGVSFVVVFAIGALLIRFVF